MPPYADELRIALAAVADACRLCESVRADDGHRRALAKDDRSPVTVADFGSQALIAAAIRDAFPGDAIVAEEDASLLRDPAAAATRDEVVAHVQAVHSEITTAAILAFIDSGKAPGGVGRFWTIDPIDGTKGFVRGDQYAVALALVVDGRVQLGVLGCPYLLVDPARPEGSRGGSFWAVRGRGAFSRPLAGDATTDRLRVDQTADPAAAVFCESAEADHSAHGTSAQVAARLGVRTAPVRMDSQCKYATVARGAAAVYLRVPTKQAYQEKIWDHAAGAVLVEEAGGRVTDVRGQPLDFSIGRELTHNVGIVATNGRLHDRVVTAVGEVLAG
ncbi:3'(2'),5'-bisphosphate nucleotidase [bacterium]|nr:3'(2'),5'-bisphosphate nucleotidase [bacterium]